MIVDTSAIVAIISGEPGHEELARLILRNQTKMSAASYVELMCVLARSSDPATHLRAERLLDSLKITIVPLSREQAQIASSAYRVYGRGSGHPAGLNLGDTFAYALAIDSHEELLFTGRDFHATDVLRAQH